MYDLALNELGDLAISNIGDVSLTESIRQIVLIRLKWIHDEWRLGPELGFPYFEDVLVKNPNLETVCALIRNEIMQIEGVTDAEVIDYSFDKQTRKATFQFQFAIEEELFREEVTLNV